MTHCYAILGAADIKALADAIASNYWYQIFIGA